MNNLIHSLEWRSYLVAIIVVFALSSMSLAAKWTSNRPSAVLNNTFLQAHVALMIGIAILGAIVVGVPAFTSSNFLALGTLSGSGIAAGVLTVAANRLIVRYARGASGLAITHRAPSGDQGQRVMRILLLTAAAILEEVLFRGYLVTIASWLPSPTLVVIALSASVLCFALAHIYGGAIEALGKLPLGAVTLMLTLGSGLLWPAIVAHIYFNLMASSFLVMQRDIPR